jgi:hypothetical protein
MDLSRSYRLELGKVKNDYSMDLCIPFIYSFSLCFLTFIVCFLCHVMLFFEAETMRIIHIFSLEVFLLEVPFPFDSFYFSFISCLLFPVFLSFVSVLSFKSIFFILCISFILICCLYEN